VTLALVYEYRNNDLPSWITESGSTAGAGSTTTFAYDRLRRLTHEGRSGANGYDLIYGYDKGGNRTRKIDYWYVPVETMYTTEYTYDNSDAVGFGSFNNRLMKTEKYDDIDPANRVLLSTTWYYYTLGGNVSRVVTREEEIVLPESMSMMSGGTVGTTVDDSLSPLPGSDEPTAEGGSEGWGEGGGVAASTVPPSACTGASKQYTATRFAYAKNGETVTFVLGEQWCWDGVSTCPTGPTNYAVTYAREFRYEWLRFQVKLSIRHRTPTSLLNCRKVLSSACSLS